MMGQGDGFLFMQICFFSFYNVFSARYTFYNRGFHLVC